MKRLPLLILLGILPLRGEAIHWRGDYEAAHREALSRKLPLLVLLVRDRCRECRSLIQRLVSDESLSRWIERTTVPVIVHAGARNSYPVELYYATCYPAIFYVESRREIILDTSCHSDASFESLKRWKEKRP